MPHSTFEDKARAVIRATASTTTARRSTSRKMARGIGWMSLGLGLVEWVAARSITRALGMPAGSERLLQACALREIACGIGLLAARDARPAAAWMWTRVAGDAVDLGVLAATRPRSAAAIGAVAAVTALDVVCARTLQYEADAARQTTDYGDRAGWSATPEEMRGAALATFRQPEDMRASVRLNGSAAH